MADPGWFRKLRYRLDPRRLTAAQRFRFLLNLAVGLLIAGSLHLVAGTQWGEGNLNWAFDWFIWDESRRVAQTPGPSDRVAFIEVDYAQYKAWGDPLFTPRDQLAVMIRGAAAGGAKVILLDVLLEYPDYDSRTDQALRDALAEVARREPPVAVVFPVRVGLNGRLRRNLYDDLIDAHPDRFHRGLPSLSATPDDRVVRHWKLFGRYHPPEQKHWRVIWGTPFLAAVLAADSLHRLTEMETRILDRYAPDGSEFHLPLGPGREVRLSTRNTDFYLQRIRFPLVPAGVLPSVPGGNIRPVAASECLGLPTLPELAQALFAGRVVVIGVSNPEGGDVHRTPVGDMAGMFVMGNSVQTILAGEQPRATPGWLDLGLEFGAILFGAFFLLHLPSLLAQFLVSIVLLVGFGGFSLWYFRQTAVFLNFVFCLLGMEILGFFTELEDLVLVEKKKDTQLRGAAGVLPVGSRKEGGES